MTTFMVYATEQGGKFAWRDTTRDEFEKVKTTGWLVTQREVSTPVVFVALCEVIEAYDTVLGSDLPDMVGEKE